MKTTEYIWMDGRFKKWKDAKIHIFTHSLHYGGIFKGIRFYNIPDGSVVFCAKEYIKYFFCSANKPIGLKIPYSQKELREVTMKLLKKITPKMVNIC